MKNRNRNSRNGRKSNVNYYIAQDGEISVLLREIEKRDEIFQFYDIKIGGIIIKDCRLIDSKNGEFVAMPSTQDNNGDYHALVYLNTELQERLTDIICDGEFDETDETILSFGSKSKSRKTKTRKTKTRKPKPETVDEDDEDNEDDNSDEDDDNPYPFD